jgi:hypothetical protein
MDSFAISDFAAVKRVKGKILKNDGYALHKLSFSNKDG